MLGAQDVGDRVQNAPLLGGSLRLDGCANGRGIDAEGLGEPRKRIDPRALYLAATEAKERVARDAGPLREGVVGLAVREKEVVEGLPALCHGRGCSETCQKIPVATVDTPNEVCQSVPINNATTAANFLGRTAAEADPTPKDQMTTNVATVPTESQLRFAREVLDRAEAEGIDTTDLAASIAAANDAAALDTDVHEARYRLNDFCAHCNEDIDADGTGSLRWCSRECWLADGGDS